MDTVYHAASTTVPATSNADPIADVEGNLVATLRLLDGFLFDVAPTDPLTLATIAALLLATTAAAAWIPGRRAARVDPLSTFRRD